MSDELERVRADLDRCLNVMKTFGGWAKSCERHNTAEWMKQFKHRLKQFEHVYDSLTAQPEACETLEKVSLGTVIHIPSEVALCPYCGAELYAQPTACEEADDGSWFATESGLECTGEPELDESNQNSLEAWDEWLAVHSEMPYVYWLPVDVKVLKWMKAKYRFS